MYTKLNASRSYVYAVARACDQNQISRRVSTIICNIFLSDRFSLSLGLCRIYPVFDRTGYRSSNGSHAMSRGQWIHQWSVYSVFRQISRECWSRDFNLDYPVGRILRDARLYAVGAGTQEIRRMLIGREFNEEFKKRQWNPWLPFVVRTLRLKLLIFVQWVTVLVFAHQGGTLRSCGAVVSLPHICVLWLN